MLSWVLFRCDPITHALNYYKALFTFSKSINTDYLNFYLTAESVIGLALAILFSIPIHKVLVRLKTININFKLTLKVTALVLLFVLNMFYVASENYNPFIYFRF